MLTAARHDPTTIFEHFRGCYATELLTAAVSHFHLFDKLAEKPLSRKALCSSLGLQERPMVVLTTALSAMGLLARRDDDFALTPMAREQLTSASPVNILGYIGLAVESPGVVEMVERLRSNRPAGAEQEEGTAFIYKEGEASAMEKEESARQLTLALAGRARNVAPLLAQRLPLDSARCLLDVGGGTGLYSIACLQRHPQLRAMVWDRPEVLKVTAELAHEQGVADRLECIPGNMFDDPVPQADVHLLSNVLHDWDVPECRAILRRCAEQLPRGGRLLIHDVFLSDTMDGPLPIALYSAALFTLTEGRAYSAAEYRSWLEDVGLTPGAITPTLVHCGVLPGTKE